MIELTLTNFIFITIAAIGGTWSLMKIIAFQFKREIKTNQDVFKRDLMEHFRVQDVAIKAANMHLNSRLDTLDAAAKTDTGQWQRVERELLTLKADLPLHYVRREDYIRGQSVIEAKLDGLGTKLENAQLRALKNVS